MTPGLAEHIAATLRAIPIGDAAEAETRDDALARLASGAPLVRQEVDTSDPHLVSYVLLTDAQRILLADHRKAGLWLPTGGHVDKGEHPRDTALREAREELGIDGHLLSDEPVFITCQRTRGSHRHRDLSLWYLMRGDPAQSYDWDRGEFHEIRWFSPEEVPADRSDPNLARCIAKLRQLGLLSENLPEPVT